MKHFSWKLDDYDLGGDGYLIINSISPNNEFFAENIANFLIFCNLCQNCEYKLP